MNSGDCILSAGLWVPINASDEPSFQRITFGVFQLDHNFPELFFELGNIVLAYLPDCIEINTHIIMDESDVDAIVFHRLIAWRTISLRI